MSAELQTFNTQSTEKVRSSAETLCSVNTLRSPRFEKVAHANLRPRNKSSLRRCAADIGMPGLSMKGLTLNTKPD